MQIIEFECKKCKHTFTRLFKDKKEAKAMKEKCIKCGGETKKTTEIDLTKMGGGCDNCSKCKGCKK